MAQASFATARLTPGELVAGLELENDETVYVGGWTPLGRAVFGYRGSVFHALPLPHSAASRGYDWGRTGSEAREVARAILLDATANEMLAERFCRPYTWEVVSQLPRDGFCLPMQQVREWAEHRSRSLPLLQQLD